MPDFPYSSLGTRTMSKNIKLIIGGVVAAIVIIAGIIGFSGSPVGQGAEGDSNFTNVVASGYITGGGALTSSGDATVSGGTLNVTTSNSATSTLIVGCIQFYATSTATALKFQASTTPGVMVSVYGTCPNL